MRPVAKEFNEQLPIPVATSWGLDIPETAEQAIADGSVGLVMIARAHLANPQWTYHAARRLGLDRPSWVLPAPYAHWLHHYDLSE